MLLCRLFLLRVLVTYHLMFALINFSFVKVTEWPPFRKELLTLLAIYKFSLYFDNL